MNSIKLMINKVRDIDNKRLNYLIDVISKKNNKSKFYVKMDMIKNFFRYGISYTDYMKGDYINLTKEQKKDYIKTKKYYEIINYLNNPEYRYIFLDKIEFNNKFKKYIGRDCLDLRNSSVEDFKKFIKNKKDFFAKKHNSFGGDGVEKIITKDIKNVEDLYNKLLENKQYLVEETIVQHDYLNKINSKAVNNIRMVTIYKDGKAHLIGNTIRLNAGEEEVISCHDIFATLDKNGNLLGNVVDDDCHIYKEHPTSKFKFKNVKIPYIKEAIKMVEKAGEVVPEVRYVGWDVAITPNGPVIIEGNFYPSYGLFQYYLLDDGLPVGKLAKIKEVLKDEAKNI